MKTPTFKKGQWLISRWKDGDVDFCRFYEHINDKEFIDDSFFRFGNSKLISTDDTDERLFYKLKYKSLQWRPATKAELKKYSQLIFS